MNNTKLRIALAGALLFATSGSLLAEPQPEVADLHVTVGWFGNDADKYFDDADSGGAIATLGLELPLAGGFDLLFSLAGGYQDLGEYTDGEHAGYRLKVECSDWDVRAMLRYTLNKDGPISPYIAGGLRVGGYEVSYSDRYDYYYRGHRRHGHWHEVDDEDDAKAGYIAQLGVSLDVVPDAIAVYAEGTVFNQRGYSLAYYDTDEDSSGHGAEVVVTGGARFHFHGGLYLMGSYSRGIESEADIVQAGLGFRF